MRGTNQDLVVGGTPRADLLPPEIRAAQRGRSTNRMLALTVIAVAVLVAGGVGYGVTQSMASSALLQQERDRSNELLAKQLEYADARQIASLVDLSIAARSIATTTEIDWKSYLDEVSATLPEGVILTSVAVASTTPTESAELAEVPLQQESVATVTIQATSVNVPDVEAWLDDLEGITGFAGIAPPATVSGSAEAGYEVGIKLLVDENAFLLRFQNEDGEN